jgi:outer membrane protein TolC
MENPMFADPNSMVQNHACTMFLILMLVSGAEAHASQQPESAASMPEPLSLGWCIERAIATNPSLDAVDAEAEATRARAGYAGRLEDPRFGYEMLNLPTEDWNFHSTPMSGHRLSLNQKLPVPGLLSSQREAAQAAVQAADAGLEDRRARIAARVELTWSALAVAQRALEITEQNLDLLRQLREIAEAKYRVGTGIQQDVIRAQLELTTLLAERLRREATLAKSEASLAALLDLPIDQHFPRTEELDQSTAIPALSDLLSRVSDASPLLRERRARVVEAKKRVRATKLESYPDVDLSIGYRIRDSVEQDPVRGQDFLSAGFTLRLPVDRQKWNAKVAEQRSYLRKAEAEYRASLATLGNEIRTAHSDLVGADAEVELLVTGLLPQARQSLESSRSGYEVARIDFLSLLDSELRLFEAELRLIQARATRRASLARLEATLGEELR